MLQLLQENGSTRMESTDAPSTSAVLRPTDSTSKESTDVPSSSTVLHVIDSNRTQSTNAPSSSAVNDQPSVSSKVLLSYIGALWKY